VRHDCADKVGEDMNKKAFSNAYKISIRIFLLPGFFISIFFVSCDSASHFDGSTVPQVSLTSIPLRDCAKRKGELQQLAPSLQQDHRSQPSYIGAITPDESLVLAVASDLRTYLHFRGKTSTKLLDEIHTAAFKLYSVSITVTENGGWLLQPGKWKDHPDYIYAGHTAVPKLAICAAPNSQDPRCNLKQRPIDGIGMDVSHFLAKWPIFLAAHRDASYDNKTRRDFFKQFISGIETQIFNSVIKPQKSSPPYLLSNYMDGTNGVYRWNYEGRGKNWGFSSFGLSSTPCYSAIALLNSDRVRELYRRIYQALPYTSMEIAIIGGETMGGDYCNRDEARLMVSLSSRFLEHSRDGIMPISNVEDELFNNTFANSLMSKDSWIGDNAYQGVVGARQVVLHSAFLAQKQEWIDTFSKHFKLFIEGLKVSGWAETSDYYKWHQLLFASRYLVLSARGNIDSKMHRELFDYLYKEVSHAWEGTHDPPISNIGWGEPPFVNYRDWVEWKICEDSRHRHDTSSHFTNLSNLAAAILG
jgi:hypothetical protein